MVVGAADMRFGVHRSSVERMHSGRDDDRPGRTVPVGAIVFS